MSSFAKVAVWFVVLIGMICIEGIIPKNEKEFLKLGVLVMFAWLIGGAAYGARGIFRFLTR